MNSRVGLHFNLSWRCSACTFERKFSNGVVNEDGIEEINWRLFYGLRMIGQGDSAANTLCGWLDLPPAYSSSEKYRDAVLPIVRTEATNSMKAACDEAKQRNNSPSITASFDGTWQTRGHSAKQAVVTCCDPYTGKVLDAEIVSRFCGLCKGLCFNYWYRADSSCWLICERYCTPRRTI